MPQVHDAMRPSLSIQPTMQLVRVPDMSSDDKATATLRDNADEQPSRSLYPPVDIVVRWWMDRAPEVFSPMDCRGTADVLVRATEMLEEIEYAKQEEAEEVSEDGTEND